MAGLGTPPAPGAPAELPGLDAPPLPSGAMPIAVSLPTPVFPEPVAEGAWPPASEPTPDKVVVSGAGMAEANGDYFWNDTDMRWEQEGSGIYVHFFGSEGDGLWMTQLEPFGSPRIIYQWLDGSAAEPWTATQEDFAEEPPFPAVTFVPGT